MLTCCYKKRIIHHESGVEKAQRIAEKARQDEEIRVKIPCMIDFLAKERGVAKGYGSIKSIPGTVDSGSREVSTMETSNPDTITTSKLASSHTHTKPFSHS